MDSDGEMIHHFCHEHPLCWIPKVVEWSSKWCFGCCRYLSPGEAVYGCKDKCSSGGYLHQDCAEMPRQIRHAVHPSHLLTLQPEKECADDGDSPSCAVCDEEDMYGLIYKCSEGEGCAAIWIHLECAGGSDAVDEPAAEIKHHPSHPRHELRLQRRKTSFQCNACGKKTDKGNSYSYICSICNYWIHESCANLPETADFPCHHPGHSLSLSFYLPYEYAIYAYTCAICDGALGLRKWVYHCRLCRYVVHLNCATTTTSPNHQIGNESDDHKDAIEGPINNIYEELIKAFVKINQVDIFIPNEKDNEIMSGKYKFHKHDHSLSFTKFLNHQNDDDDDDISRLASVISITCDACTLPIHEKYSSSDSGYMFCGECNYFLHLSCFNLPPELSSHPLHPIENHQLTLQLPSCNKLKHWSKCRVCFDRTNGLVYGCTDVECGFILDIKCASLPDAMKHAGHPRPHHFLKLVVGTTRSSSCSACCKYADRNFYMSCNRCRFLMCLRCVFLPASNKHGLEKHRMPLTYDASVNHPSDFYCGSCEDKMNPKTWMYHCRLCEESFNPRCFPATSGRYRNINFGSNQHYTMNVTTNHHLPRHLLKFQIITNKKYCDLCPQPRHVYDKPGFQCADCNFVSCMKEHPSVSITIHHHQEAPSMRSLGF